MRAPKYMGGMPGDWLPVDAAEVKRVIHDSIQYGTVAERKSAVMRHLAEGGTVTDANGFSIRLAKLPT